MHIFDNKCTSGDNENSPVLLFLQICDAFKRFRFFKDSRRKKSCDKRFLFCVKKNTETNKIVYKKMETESLNH